MTNVLQAAVFPPGAAGMDGVVFFGMSDNVPLFPDIVNPASSRSDDACSLSVGKKQRSKYLPPSVFLMSWKLVNFLPLTSQFPAISVSRLQAKGRAIPQHGACHWGIQGR